MSHPTRHHHLLGTDAWRFHPLQATFLEDSTPCLGYLPGNCEGKFCGRQREEAPRPKEMILVENVRSGEESS